MTGNTTRNAKETKINNGKQSTNKPLIKPETSNVESKWYKYMAKLQAIINSTIMRSSNYGPFELMTGL